MLNSKRNLLKLLVVFVLYITNALMSTNVAMQMVKSLLLVLI